MIQFIPLSITRLDLSTGDIEVIANGVRNTVGFDWDPGTGDLWFTDNGRDWLGDDEPKIGAGPFDRRRATLRFSMSTPPRQHP